MKYLYYTLIITIITVSSCKNNDVEKVQTGSKVVVPFTQQNASSLQNQNVQTPVVQKSNLFQENNTLSSPSVAQNLNPAHGQPNHRCDIAVGAPLNSPSNTAAPEKQTRAQSTQVITPIQNSIAKTVTPKGINPPHGEIGHRCDISVGAPLNSKPASEQVKVEQNIPVLLAPSTSQNATPEE